MKRQHIRRFIGSVIIVVIIVLGVFKEWFFQFLRQRLSDSLDDNIFGHIEGLISLYDSGQTGEDWLINYLIYYPIYIICHFTLIFIIFYNERKIAKIVSLILTVTLVILVSGKFITGYLGLYKLVDFFDETFHKIVGLPFLLLFLEGGRYFYNNYFIENDE